MCVVVEGIEKRPAEYAWDPQQTEPHSSHAAEDIWVQSGGQVGWLDCGPSTTCWVKKLFSTMMVFSFWQEHPAAARQRAGERPNTTEKHSKSVEGDQGPARLSEVYQHTL